MSGLPYPYQREWRELSARNFANGLLLYRMRKQEAMNDLWLGAIELSCRGAEFPINPAGSKNRRHKSVRGFEFHSLRQRFPAKEESFLLAPVECRLVIGGIDDQAIYRLLWHYSRSRILSGSQSLSLGPRGYSRRSFGTTQESSRAAKNLRDSSTNRSF